MEIKKKKKKKLIILVTNFKNYLISHRMKKYISYLSNISDLTEFSNYLSDLVEQNIVGCWGSAYFSTTFLGVQEGSRQERLISQLEADWSNMRSKSLWTTIKKGFYYCRYKKSKPSLQIELTTVNQHFNAVLIPTLCRGVAETELNLFFTMAG